MANNWNQPKRVEEGELRENLQTPFTGSLMKSILGGAASVLIGAAAGAHLESTYLDSTFQEALFNDNPLPELGGAAAGAIALQIYTTQKLKDGVRSAYNSNRMY